jgi:hypothetical protein
MHRADIKALRKVWVTYGQAHLPLIDKYVKRSGLEIIFQNLGGASFILPFPLRGFVYVGNFHLMHLFAFLFIIGVPLSLIFGGIVSWALTALALILTFYFGFQYIKWHFDMEPKDKFWFWGKIKYQTNLSFIQGGLKDFKKFKILCVEPSF